jgi:dephospho-CoA kinase
VTPVLAVGLSGRIGSGKTSLATALAERLQCPRASFGDYVRSVASGRGLDAEDRSVLQDLGGSVVVDGIRHAQAADTMRALLAPTPWRLVAVDSENEVRLSRLAARGVVGAGARTADTHPNETQVGAVMDSADFVVSGNSTVEDAVNAVMTWLDSP